MSSSTDDGGEPGGVQGSQAQPIDAVIDMTRANHTVWGNDFKVWLGAVRLAAISGRIATRSAIDVMPQPFS